MKIKPGDWCFFQNPGEPIVFGQFVSKSGKYYYGRTHCNSTPRFQYCMKYIGLIPTFEEE